ncbi:hypothetical protein HYT25_04170 [Candidatus Pacearchaeota archaeon]|nr:hypothetical protein [Candidatus Pacearchaeota archaeon]
MDLESERLAGEIFKLEGLRQYELEGERLSQTFEYFKPMIHHACDVARAFTERLPVVIEDNLVFEYKGLKIESMLAWDSNSSFEIHYQNDLVFRWRDTTRSDGLRDITDYVPGEWEKMIEELHPLAERAKKNLESTSRRN